MAAGSYTLTVVATDNLGVQTTSSGVGITVNGGGSGSLPSGSLSLWLKADTGVTTSGSSVTQWNDQSGSGNNVTPQNGNDPTLVSNVINSLPVIRFNGTSNNLGSPVQHPAVGYLLLLRRRAGDHRAAGPGAGRRQ